MEQRPINEQHRGYGLGLSLRPSWAWPVAAHPRCREGRASSSIGPLRGAHAATCSSDLAWGSTPVNQVTGVPQVALMRTPGCVAHGRSSGTHAVSGPTVYWSTAGGMLGGMISR